MENPAMRRAVAAIAALIGGFPLYASANPASDFGTTLSSFWAGVALFAGVAWLLLRSYRPGTDIPSDDEVDIREWRFVRFLRYGREAVPGLGVAWGRLAQGLGSVLPAARSQSVWRFQSPCDGIRRARLNLLEAFSQATISVNSTMASSSNRSRSRPNSSSETSRPVMVMLSAYSRTVRSVSSKSGLVGQSRRASSFSSEMPRALPTAALMSCQNAQPFW
jgi:hypothetical protein